MESTSRRAWTQSKQQPLSEAIGANVPFGTMVGWRVPGGDMYGVVVKQEGKELLVITAYDKTLVNDKGVRFYRDDVLSEKLTPMLPTLRMSVQRVPASKAFKHMRVTGPALQPYLDAAKQLQMKVAVEGRGGRSMSVFSDVTGSLQAIREGLGADESETESDVTEEELGEGTRKVLHWIKQKHGAAKMAAHRAFLKVVRKDPAAHRRKMLQDKKYHRTHKWHDKLMQKTSRPGWVRHHIRAHVEIPDDLMPMDERDPGQAFMDLPFEFRVTERRQPDPESMKVQTLIFSKEKFTKASAKAWAKSHGFKAGKVDEKTNTYRLRQRDPGQFETFRTIEFKPGLKAVVAKI